MRSRLGASRRHGRSTTGQLQVAVTTQYAAGTVQKFDDLPAAHRANIDRQLPLDGRAPGSTPTMTEQQISDLLCFLETLTDDYRPGSTPESGRCVE